MTFYDWAMSKYYDDSCPLTINLAPNLKDGIIAGNVSCGDRISITTLSGFDLNPTIYTDTIIQPISYITNMGGIDEIG